MDQSIRNWKFDYIKGIACIVVVLLHVPIPGPIGEAIIYGCRFSVPIFFMITGYYSESKSNAWILKKTKDLLIKLVITEFLYGIWKLFLWTVIDGKEIGGFFGNTAIAKEPVKTLFFGSIFNGALWYMYAAVWTYLLVLLLRKIKLIGNPVFCIVYVFLMITFMVAGRMIIQSTENIDELAFLFCNAVTFGLPMVITGMFFARYEEKIRNKISLGKNILILFAGGLVMCVEYLLYGKYMDFHVSTFIISCAIFFFAFTYKKEGIILKRPLCFIGQKLSLWIYLDHFFVNAALLLLLGLIIDTENNIYKYVHPFLVIAMSIIVALFIYLLKKSIKRSKA